MPKQLALRMPKKSSALQISPEELAEWKVLRKAQRDTSQRVEALKIRLFTITERHMDQAICIIRRWIHE